MTTKKKAKAKKVNPRLGKPNPQTNRMLAEEVTDRFMDACRELVKRKDQVRNFSRLAGELGAYKTIFTKLKDPKDDTNIPLHMVARLCSIYKVNGDWLLTGHGSMWAEATPEERLQNIERALAEMGKNLKVADKKK